jgi:hypothetical protein
MEYFQQLVSRAWTDTWEVVFGVPLRGIVVAIVVFAFTLLLHWRRKGLEDMKDVLFGGIEGASAAIILFVLVFLLHLFVLSPKYIASDLQKELHDEKRVSGELRNTIDNSADTSNRIKLDVADEQGRKELEKTKKELAEAKAIIDRLDPKQQPIASATASVQVTIESDQPVNSHFMDRGGAAAFVRGATPLLITQSIDCFGNQTGQGRVVYHGVFSMQADDPAVGKQTLTLQDAEYIQCEFTPMPDDAHVISGKVVFTINGVFRLEFDIPPQTAVGKRIFVRDLSSAVDKWTTTPTP